MSTLKGKIVFHLNLDESSNEISTSRKRQRSSSDILQETKSKHDVSGFIFYPDPGTWIPFGIFDYLLLSVPRLLLRRASKAAAFKIPVEITRYSCVPLVSSGQSQGAAVALLEIHNNGLHFLSQPSQSPPQCSLSRDDFWTLSHFRRRELVEMKELRAAGKEKHNIIATVDAISPIIALDPKDPFCLVELYDKANEENNCVLVLTGKHALVWQPSIQPGDTLRLVGLYRKRWQVPNSFACKTVFQHLKCRIPPFVFVFSQSSRLFWDSDSPWNDVVAEQDDSMGLPTTPVPLVSLEGTILSVERKLTKRDSSSVRFIHSIDVDPDTDSGGERSLYRILLGKFPMSLDLQLSLQNGARIRAINLHPLGCASHLPRGVAALGACLRSTVTLVLCPSSEKSVDEQGLYAPLVQHGPRYSLEEERSMLGMIPYRLAKIRLSYRDGLLKQHAQEWLEECFYASSENDDAAPLPSSEDLVALIQNDFEDNDDDSLGEVARQKKSTTSRNPYAEFFDHAFDDDLVSDVRPVGLCGCTMTREESSSNHDGPQLVGLNHIRMAGLRALGKRFAKYVEVDSVPRGWSGSIHLKLDELHTELDSIQQNISRPLYVGGFGSTDNQTGEVVGLSDRICQLSLRTTDNKPRAKSGAFFTGRVESVIVSCFCMVSAYSNESEKSKISCNGAINVQSLPPVDFSLFDSVMGGGAIVRLGGFILVASVQLRCSRMLETDTCLSKMTQNGSFNLESAAESTITACLTNPKHLRACSKSVKGVLIRSRFRHAKINPNGLSECLILTLSDFSRAGGGRVSPQFLQTIDVKVAVPHSTSKMIKFKQALTALVCEELMVLEDECTRAVSWWTVADGCQSSPLIAGGWEEMQSCSRSQQCGVGVSLPVDSFVATNRGYVRCTSRLDSLRTEFVQTIKNQEHRASTTCRMWDSICARSFFDGMLCRRLSRKAPVADDPRTRVGELWFVPPNIVPSCTVSELFMLACATIRSGDSCSLSPSLVRRIPNANFLGIAYCCAACKCSRCFEHLVQAPTAELDDYDDEPSFWHLPAPEGLYLQNGRHPAPPENRQGSRCPPHIRKSRLRCPQNCAMEHAVVHWECSGFLDDGTGQAKLYAEREAALSLLGIPAPILGEIEKGIWASQTGVITYTKSIPPSSYLREQVNFAMSKVTRNGPSALQLLAPEIRAEYLVHHHCRTSTRPTRRLDYFVRCKPLSDNISHLNHTTIESFVSSGSNGLMRFSSEVASYGLPPLKLDLVDCSIPFT